MSSVSTGACEVMLYLHANRTPTHVEWADSMSQLDAAIRRVGLQKVRALVITDGGGPDADMRAELKALYERQRFAMPTAVLASSALVRSVVGAIHFFSPSIKSFSPLGFDAALSFLDVPLSARARLLDTARSMQAALPLVACLRLIENAQTERD